jgi:hypothetical protein
MSRRSTFEKNTDTDQDTLDHPDTARTGLADDGDGRRSEGYLMHGVL